MRRFAPFLIGLGIAAILAVLMIGTAPVGEIPGVALLALGAIGVAVPFAFGRGRQVAERSWSGRAPTPVSGSPAPVRPEVSSAGSVALALARVEARELLVSPSFGVGFGFCVLVYVLFGIVFASDNYEAWGSFLQLSSWFVHPLVGLVVVGSFRAVTRARRDGADELFDSCPAGPSTRTWGFLGAAVAPVGALTVFLAVLLVTVAIRSPLLHGPIGGDELADLAVAVALGAGGVALGVALAQWVRFALTPIVVVVAVALATSALNTVGGGDWNPLAALSTAPTVEGPSPVFADRAPQWHLVWILALSAVVAVVALLRHRRDRRVLAFGAAAVVLALVSGLATTRPLTSGSAARIAHLVAHPDDHQDCTSIGARVDVCVFATHRALVRGFVDGAEPVARMLPEAAGSFILRQRYDGELEDLPPEVRRRLRPQDLRRPSGEVALDFGGDGASAIGGAGFNLALASVGIPAEADDRDLPTVLAGQARGVVALWLATRGQGADAREELTTSPDPASSDAFDRGSLDGAAQDDCSNPAAVWSVQDLAAVRSTLSLPEADVAEVLARDWGRWADPRTGTDDLLDALGLPPVGPFDDVVARPGNPC